jgi:hypothetical protein
MATVNATWKQKSTGNIIHPETDVDQLKSSGQNALASIITTLLKSATTAQARAAIESAAATHQHSTGDIQSFASNVVSAIGEETLAALGVRYSITTNGYICFGQLFGGLILQWGDLSKITLPDGSDQSKAFYLGHLDNAGSHNALYRGCDLTDYFNSGAMSTAIANGSFKNIYPGDYITKSVTVDGTTYSNIKWIVGDLDYYWRRGGTDLKTHHVLIFPETFLGTARMNPTSTTEGGYVGSEMWTETIPKYVTGIQAAFGTSHVLKHNELLTTSVDLESEAANHSRYIGATNNWAWTDVLVNIFNEAMVYGTTPVGSSMFDIGNCNTQVAAMRHNKSLSFSRAGWCWLRSVPASSDFAVAHGPGFALGTDASLSGGRVRPYFLLT